VQEIAQVASDRPEPFAILYAFEKTGLLVTEQNQHLIPDEDLAEWDAAIEECERQHRGTG
jgi:hypothetical protein